MGLPIATNLSKDFEVTGFDPVDEGEARIRCGYSSRAQRTSRRGADFVVLAVRNQEQLDTALYGEDGVVEVLEEAPPSS